jgi:hypothetical protein
MAVRAANIAFIHFCLQLLDCPAPAYGGGYRANLFASDMIKLKDYGVFLSAVDARMVGEIFQDDPRVSCHMELRLPL